MNPNRMLLALLVATSLAVDVVLVVLLSDRGAWPDPLVAVALGLAGGQINLATLWAVLGHRRLPWRTAAMFGTPAAWALAFGVWSPGIVSGYRNAATWGLHFLTQMVVLASVAFLVRLWGAKLLPADLGHTRNTPRRWQFTLRYLFAWLTATAIALSLLKTTFDRANLARDFFDDWQAVLILGFVNSMLGLTGIWLIDDTRALSTRILAALLTLFPAAGVVAWVFWVAATDHLLAVLLLWLAVALYSALTSSVLRLAGFRLLWPTAPSVLHPERHDGRTA